ncbi:enamine deaminase RidA [Photobacterium kishitanii]|uniref:Rid family hydrolase n=1 Tax=Photobacterium kishitanii TaxID=318456 RepID=UPI000D15107E|nr:Rid family hydrolase [Photobacterium kishitanii]PSU86699.1 enamine deaminase RidA [Photobacterium kishitanii]
MSVQNQFKVPRRRVFNSLIAVGLASVALLSTNGHAATNTESKLDRTIVNPWDWREYMGLVQGNEVKNVSSIFFVGGQASVDEYAATVHPGDMGKQIAHAFDKLEIVLGEAGYELSDVVRLTYYTTDIAKFRKEFGPTLERLKAKNCNPSAALIGVAELANPDLMFELEATAVK